ncbi:unnamed protein product [Camellia sinensis]
MVVLRRVVSVRKVLEMSSDQHAILVRDTGPANGLNSMDEAGPIFTIDDEALPESFETQAKHNSEQAIKTSDLLSVNKLLES